MVPDIQKWPPGSLSFEMVVNHLLQDSFFTVEVFYFIIIIILARAIWFFWPPFIVTKTELYNKYIIIFFSLYLKRRTWTI